MELNPNVSVWTCTGCVPSRKLEVARSTSVFSTEINRFFFFIVHSCLLPDQLPTLFSLILLFILRPTVAQEGEQANQLQDNGSNPTPS